MLDNKESVMDVPLDELLQEAILDEDNDVDFDENEDSALYISDLNDGDDNGDVKVPQELSDYLNFLESKTQHLEKDLEECDELLLYMPHQSKDPSRAVVLYDDFQILEKSAKEHGMTVDEFKEKILNDLEQDDFTEDDVNCEFEEFAQLKKELEEIRSATNLDRTDDVKAILASEDKTDEGRGDFKTSGVTVLAIDNVDAGNDVGWGYGLAAHQTKSTEVGALVSESGLSSMREYVVEQLRKAERSHEVMSINLAKSTETYNHEEEMRLLQQEEQRHRLKELHVKEEAAMAETLKERERVLAEEQKIRDEELRQELKVSQAEIDESSQALEMERCWFEESQGLWLEKMEAARQQAARRIQQVYRGHRSRRQNQSVVRELEEWKEARKEEKHKLRVMEMEYEMKYREELALKEKEKQETMAVEERRRREEEDRQIEIERKKKEENERIMEELRKEMMKVKEEKRLEVEQRKKEGDEVRKREEEKRVEEERLRKEEETMRRNEEKRRLKEEKLQEKQKRKDEIKQKKEEEKRVREEEEKMKKEEEKRIKDKEKKKKEEEKRIKEEEKRRKEEEKRIKEEEKRRMEEEKTKKEEEIRKQEEARKIKEEEKRKREEERKFKEEENVKQEQEKMIGKEENIEYDETINMNNKRDTQKMAEHYSHKEEIILKKVETTKHTNKDEIMPKVDKRPGETAHTLLQQELKKSLSHAEPGQGTPVSGCSGQHTSSSTLFPQQAPSPGNPVHSAPSAPTAKQAEDKRMSPAPTAKQAEDKRMSPAPTAKQAEDKRMSPAPTAKQAEDKRMSPAPTAKQAEDKRMSPAPTAKQAEDKRMSPAPTAKQAEDKRVSPAPHEHLHLSPRASATSAELATDKSCLVKPWMTSGMKPAAPQEPVTARARQLPSTLELIEPRRLSWIKSCIPWSKISCEPWKLNQTLQKSHKRPSQARKLPPVSESVVLGAAHASSLREVSSVKLTDLPECSVSTLGQCWSLRYLTVTKCGLTLLDGLKECKHLLYINAEDNNIEYVDLKDLGSLQVVKLAHNKLSIIHGLDGCINLRWLDLSHNRITRIYTAGLSSLRRAHTLDLSNNQIVSCQGLEQASTLQQLDLSHNFLQHFTDVSKLCLLTHLNLSCNNLLKVPDLKNQVLLQNLHLQENSIRTMEPLEKCWLPLLCFLDCSKNMLECVAGVSSLIQLSHLDVSLNQITDLESLLPGLSQNRKLETLLLEGNPLIDVYNEEYKQVLAAAMPLLKSVDHEPVNLHQSIKSPNMGSESDIQLENSDKFIQMCSSQIGVHADLRNEFQTQMKVLLVNCHVTGETLCSTYFTFCDTSFKMAADHRSAHEHGYFCASNSVSNFSVSVIDEKAKFHSAMEIKQQQGTRTDDDYLIFPVDCVVGNQSELEFAHNKLASCESEPSRQNQFNPVSGSDSNNINSSLNSVTPQYRRLSSCATSKYSVKDSAIVQSNYNLRQDTHYGQESFVIDSGQSIPNNNPNHNISSKTDNQYEQHLSGKNKFEMVLQAQKSSSATVAKNKTRTDEISTGSVVASHSTNPDHHISGVKDSVVGNPLSSLDSGERSEEAELPAHDVDISFDFMGFDIDKYLDMEELDEFLGKEWRPGDIPQSQYPVLDKISPGNSNGTYMNKGHNNGGHGHSPQHPPHQPSHAWTVPPASSDRKSKSPNSGLESRMTSSLAAASPISVASAAETIAGGSVRSKKEELSEEWGFKNSNTVEMMLARAKKMKYNSERRRKLSQLDPQQRLLMLKKIEEKYRMTGTKPPYTKVLPRKEYFKAREEEAQRQEVDVRAESNTRAHRLFEWLHTQVGEHSVSSSRIQPGLNSGGITAHNTKYGTTMGEINPRELSPLSEHQKSVYKDLLTMRRYSTGEAHTGSTLVLPPIPQCSTSSSNNKERISFRDSPVVRSGGWGGGRKKENRK